MNKLRMVSEAPPSIQSPYDEWGRLRRFLESSRMALARERDLWASLGIDKAGQVHISAPEDQASYSVTVEQHVDAIEDAELLHASVLILSYAFAKSAAADRLRTDTRSLGCIEDWGSRLLGAEKRGWNDVRGGLAGAVETAVIRNAFAHGLRTLDDAARRRLFEVGAPVPPQGSRVTLTYTELREFRARLRSLLKKGGISRAASSHQDP